MLFGFTDGGRKEKRKREKRERKGNIEQLPPNLKPKT